MNIDFALVLVLLVAVSGAIWLFDILLLAPHRKRDLAALGPTVTEAEKVATLKPSAAVEHAQSFFPVFLVVLLLRSFLAEPFRIPSGSMMPTLVEGDFILVNKFGYGLRWPVLNTKFIPIGNPERGDVVVFRYPRDPRIPYIKRIVGLPGDRVEYKGKVVYINGTAVPQTPVGTYQGFGSSATMTGASERREDLLGVNHAVLIVDKALERATPDWGIVPPGHYFVLGDNRDNSQDSRFWGFVPEGNLVGQAFFIWFNLDMVGGWAPWTWRMDWGRPGTWVE